MSILPVLQFVREFNKEKASIFDTSKNYVLSEEDERRLNRIFEIVLTINPPYIVTLKIRRSSGQLYLECMDKQIPQPKTDLSMLTLPPIKQDAKKA